MPKPAATVVGAGLSGIACALVLREAGWDVSVRERGRTVGGRMATRRIAVAGAERIADIGASYFTARDPGFQTIVDHWCAAGLARPWTSAFHSLDAEGLQPGKPGPIRYATPGGLRSLVRDLAAGLEPVRTQAPASSVTSADAASGTQPAVDGEPADVVVLAMPDPQAQQLLEAGSPAHTAVADRAWEPVLALTAVFEKRSWPAFDGAFVDDDPTLSFVADDGARRGDGAQVLVAHSTGPFAGGHLTDPASAAPELVAAVDRLLHTGSPTSAHVHRWTFARPAEPREESSYWDPAAGIGICGDAWGSPRVETAWLSGQALGRRIAGR